MCSSHANQDQAKEREVKVRPLSKADLHAMVQLHMNVYQEEYNISKSLGYNFVRATYTFFLTDRKSYGFGAFINGTLVGYVLGRLDYFSDDLNRYPRRIFALACALIRRPWLLANNRVREYILDAIARVFARVCKRRKLDQSLEDAPSHSPGKTATIASTCVDHAVRIPHVSHSLLETAEKFCRDNGMRFLRASMLAGNVPCRFLHTLRKYAVDEVLSDEESVYYFICLDEQTPETVDGSTAEKEDG